MTDNLTTLNQTNDLDPVSTGVKSVSNAFKILDVVAQNNGPISLKEIGRRAGVSPSKAHRYLQSLCACGMLNQAFKSGNYDLGEGAMRLGLSAVNRVDIVNRAGDALPGLVQELNADACLTVWSDLGPTIVRFERSCRPAAAMLGAGVSFPIFTSATGLIYLAFAEAAMMESLKRAEHGYDNAKAGELNNKLSSIKAAGYASTAGILLPGRFSIAAPIISFDDRVIAGISIFTKDAQSAEPNGALVRRLLDFCKRYSMPKRGYMEETMIERKIAV